MSHKRIRMLSILDIPTQIEVERKRRFVIIFASLFCFFSTISVISAFLVMNTVNNVMGNLPDAKGIKSYKRDQTTLIYDINDKLVANIHGDEDRVIVPLNKISPYLQRAVVSIEDNRFYEHQGVDLVGTLRAAFTNAGGGGSMQGGSTLTQQLVKNTYLSPERSLKRKLIEALLAVEIERNYDKNKILEMYLNQVYWGNMSYGAEKASRRYFKKSANQLDLAEASLLAGLLKAPEGLSPYTNLKMAKVRQKLVLERMEHYGYITRNQRFKAENEKLKFASHKQNYAKYSYFISYVSYLLRKTYGDEVVKRGGLRVYTTLDPQVQTLAEQSVKNGVKKLPKSTGVSQGALVSIKNETGYIQAMVGGIDYEKSNYNRAFQAKRAVGSSFKPVVYLTGFRLGKITPESPIVDAPISFNTGWNIWCPHNWDGKYMGKMTIRRALTLSRNTPTVRIGLKVGLAAIIETARALGIRSHINRDYSIVLGSLGISPLELATMYSTLARNGVYIDPIAIRKVYDNQGNLIEEHVPNPVQVVSPGFVKNLDSILIDVVEKGTGKLAMLKDRKVAGKTGTTDDVKDIWFNGFTPDTTTIVWMGNDNNTKLHGVFSSNCAEVWGKFSTEYYKIKKIPPHLFSAPVKIAVIKPEKPQKKDNKSDNAKKHKTKTMDMSKNNKDFIFENYQNESSPKKRVSHKAVERVEFYNDNNFENSVDNARNKTEKTITHQHKNRVLQERKAQTQDDYSQKLNLRPKIYQNENSQPAQENDNPQQEE